MVLLLSLAFAADGVAGSDTLATGNTAVANPWTNSGVSANPAILGLTKRYMFGFSGSYGQRGLHWHVTAVDSKTPEYFALGLTYSGDRYNPTLLLNDLPGWQVPDLELTNHKRNHDLGASLAIPLFNRYLSLGVGGSISFFDHERKGKGNTGNLTAGIAARANDHLSFGASARNILPIQAPNNDRPMEFLAGVHLMSSEIGSFSLEGGARPEQPDNILVLGAGGEARVSEGVILRGGWRFEDASHAVTFGAGAGTQEAGVDLGFSIPTQSLLQPADWTVQLSIRVAGPDMDKIQPN